MTIILLNKGQTENSLRDCIHIIVSSALLMLNTNQWTGLNDCTVKLIKLYIGRQYYNYNIIKKVVEDYSNYFVPL